MGQRKGAIILFLSILALTGCGPSATQLEDQAVKAFDEGQVKEAKSLMDQALTINADHSPETEYNIARIATAYYEQFERDQRESPARIQAIKSYINLFRSGEIKNHDDDGREKLNLLASSLFEDLLFSLNTNNYRQSQADFNLYRISMALVQPDFDISESQISYFMVLASVYMQLTETDPDNKPDHLRSACDTYQKVVDIAPENINANYNLGMIYFKTALNLADKIAGETGGDPGFTEALQSPSEMLNLYRNLESNDLDGQQLTNLQNSFRKSITYLETVYKNDPTEIISYSLLLCYYVINDQEQYDAIHEELMSSE